MIKKISIENFKSIEKVVFNFNNNHDIICLIGKNGSGKSNIFKAIKYFFDYINKPYSEENIIDNSNPYIQKCMISIVFDLNVLRSKSRYNSELSNRFETIEHYIYKNYANISSSNKLELELKMVQYKDGVIKWNIRDKNICDTIKTLFPLYYIDTRRLDLFTWEHLWETISDLSAAMPQKNQDEYRNIIDNAFSEIYGDKYTSSKDRIEKVFEKHEVSLDPYHFDSRYKNAFAMRFGGEQFLVDGKPLSYFSDGTSSYKYLVLLSTLIPQISKNSCKYPIMLLDEPEIGLHSEYISGFVKCISENINNNALMFFSTHSPKLISDLTNSQVKFQLYKINKIGLHSEANKMNTSWLTAAKHKITVKETECYFYDYLVYVEGETEVELFNHKKIRELFSKLDQIHFYSFDANHERLNSVNADNINLGAKYKLITDMDQILSYSQKRNKFKLAPTDINPIKSKTTINSNNVRYFSQNSIDISTIYNNINDLIRITQNKGQKHYIDNEQYNSLISYVRTYCNVYNIIVNWSTIEGELITYENIELFIEFMSMQEIKPTQQHNNILAISDKKEKMVLILCEYRGKTEYFDSKGKVIFQGKGLQTVVSEKTGGWVSKWLNYYFQKSIDTLENTNEKKATFKRDFPGLYNTLQELENMVH